jgi:hypothetical protein
MKYLETWGKNGQPDYPNFGSTPSKFVEPTPQMNRIPAAIGIFHFPRLYRRPEGAQPAWEVHNA